MTFVETYQQLGELLAGGRPYARPGAFADAAEQLRDHVYGPEVADAIPRQVRTVLEFLDEQMSTAEVFAVEVRQYVDGSGDRTLVPRTIGRTRKAAAAKRRTAAGPGSASRERWTLDEIAADLERRHGTEVVELARRLHDEAAARMQVVFNSGRTHSSFVAYASGPHRDVHLLQVRSSGEVTLPLKWLRSQPPFDAERLRAEYRRRVEQALPLPADVPWEPSAPIATLADDGAFARLLAALDWAHWQVRSARDKAADQR